MTSATVLPFPSAADAVRGRELLAALAQLPKVSVAPALAHLAAPVGCLVGMQLVLDGGTATFRGRSSALPTLRAPLAVALAGLVRQGQLPSEGSLTLDGAPATWLKAVRSGHVVILGGVPELFGGPVVRVDVPYATPGLLEELRAAAAAGCLSEWARGPRGRSAGAVSGPGSLWVRGVGAAAATKPPWLAKVANEAPACHASLRPVAVGADVQGQS